MDSTRDTHFLGFAKQELEDLKPDLTLLFVALGSPLSRREEEIESAERILIERLAQRAYDLAVHVLGHQLAADHYRWPALSAQEAIRDGNIPDLTTLPPAAPESTTN